MKSFQIIAGALLLVQLNAITVSAQTTAATDPAITADNGSGLFERACASCHTPANVAPLVAADATQGNVRAPTFEILQALSPGAIVTALTTGKMEVQGAQMSEQERIAVAQFVTGRILTPSDALAIRENRCVATPPLSESFTQPGWNGWGNGRANTRYQSAEAATLTVADIPRLELAWAFGFPDVSSARTQPAVVGQWLYTASDKGEVFALDAKTGCTHWAFQAMAAVRSAISVAPLANADGSTTYLALFGDSQANAYAVNAETGALVWTHEIDSHPNGSITGAPAIYEGRVFFPVSASGEEVRGTNPDYECCTFRGSVSALDLATGDTIWKTYSIPQEPAPRGTSTTGKQLYGPAGAGIWNSPTIDAGRGVLYVGTGNGFAEPQPLTTDAILALDLESGAMRWSQQTTPNDVWLYQCESEANRNNANCPTMQGPDFDFGASPVLTQTRSGRALLIATQKSGMVYAMDPDANGAKVWEYRIGEGSDLGGQWGAATDGENVYAGVADTLSPAPGGIHAIALESGRRAWFAEPRPTLCEGGTPARCFAAQGAAVSVIPGAVFSGGSDGGLRAYSTADGSLIWEYDTNRSFDTVNGVTAAGATIDAAGPVVVDGMVYVNSGYTGIVGRGGNVLLAFRVGGE